MTWSCQCKSLSGLEITRLTVLENVQPSKTKVNSQKYLGICRRRLYRGTKVQISKKIRMKIANNLVKFPSKRKQKATMQFVFNAEFRKRNTEDHFKHRDKTTPL